MKKLLFLIALFSPFIHPMNMGCGMYHKFPMTAAEIENWAPIEMNHCYLEPISSDALFQEAANKIEPYIAPYEQSYESPVDPNPIENGIESSNVQPCIDSTYDPQIHIDYSDKETNNYTETNHKFDPRFSDGRLMLSNKILMQVEFNEFEAKILQGNGHELAQLRTEYAESLNKWYRFWGKAALREKITQIDDALQHRCTDQLIKDFFVIRHGNTQEAQKALARLKLAQKARYSSPQCQRYKPKGLLLNQHKIAYAVALHRYKIAYAVALHRSDGQKFEYKQEIVPITEENYHNRLTQAIHTTRALILDKFYLYGPYSVKLLDELHSQRLFSLTNRENEHEFKQIIINSLQHYLISLIPTSPLKDPKPLIIGATQFGAALICNMFVPGSGTLVYGASTVAKLIQNIRQIHVTDLNTQQVGNLLAEQAANITWSIIGNKVGTFAAKKTKTPKISEPIQKATETVTQQQKPQKDIASSISTENTNSVLKPLGRGSTGRIEPQNLNEQLAMEEIMTNPTMGEHLEKVIMTDPRWPKEQGWKKMYWDKDDWESNSIRRYDIHIHYLAQYDQHGNIIAIDDFKFTK